MAAVDLVKRYGANAEKGKGVRFKPTDPGPRTFAELVAEVKKDRSWKTRICSHAAMIVCYELSRVTTEQRDNIMSEALRRYAKGRLRRERRRRGVIEKGDGEA